MLFSTRSKKSHKSAVTRCRTAPSEDKPCESPRGSHGPWELPWRRGLLKKPLKGKVPWALAWEKPISLYKSHKNPAASSIPFRPTCTLSFPPAPGLILSHLAPCAQQVGCQVSVQEDPACPVAPSQGSCLSSPRALFDFQVIPRQCLEGSASKSI